MGRLHARHERRSLRHIRRVQEHLMRIDLGDFHRIRFKQDARLASRIVQRAQA